MRQANLRAVHGYRTRRWAVGKPSVLTPTLLQRQLPPRRPTPPGSRTSPTSARGKDGSTWLLSWICSHADRAGPLTPPFIASSCSTRC
jgi:hypothetical protein